MSGRIPTLHMLCRKIAAGKSTVAARLGEPPATIVAVQVVSPPDVVRRLRDFPGLLSLVCVCVRGQVAEGRVGPLLVVVAPPFFDAHPGVGQGQEPRGVQALGPEPGVERLDERVVRGFSGREKSISTPFR